MVIRGRVVAPLAPNFVTPVLIHGVGTVVVSRCLATSGVDRTEVVCVRVMDGSVESLGDPRVG